MTPAGVGARHIMNDALFGPFLRKAALLSGCRWTTAGE